SIQCSTQNKNHTPKPRSMRGRGNAPETGRRAKPGESRECSSKPPQNPRTLGRGGGQDLEGWINLSNITSASCGKLTIYLFKRNDTSVLGVSEAQPSQISAVFEYPPRSFASVLFFMVNPEVERFLRDLSGEHLRSKKNLDALSTWEYVYDRVRVTKVERDIVRPKKLEYGDAVGSALDVSDSQRYRVLSSVSTRTVGSGEDLRRFFTVKLKKAGLNPEYFMTSEFEMAYLMRKLLPRSDVVALLEDASSLLQMVRKVPVLVKAVEQLDDEWFTKQV
ncbi:MAG: hypothetical protein QXQ90_07045, partial [Desulfurococcaceae archaeon]